MSKNTRSNFFIVVLLVLIFLSAGVSYYKYMVTEDLTYFTTEESVPDRFNLESYK